MSFFYVHILYCLEYTAKYIMNNGRSDAFLQNFHLYLFSNMYVRLKRLMFLPTHYKFRNIPFL